MAWAWRLPDCPGCLAGRAAVMTGKRPVWFYIVLGSWSIRAQSHNRPSAECPATGDPLIGTIAQGVLGLAAVVGSPLWVELLFAPLRVALLDIKELWDLRRQLRDAKKEHKKAFRFLRDWQFFGRSGNENPQS